MGHQHQHGNSNNLGWAFAINLGFAVLEVIGGTLTNSVAILSDALHDLGDSLSLGLAWVLGRYAEREGTQRFTYGFRRLSLLGALINSIVLVVGSIYILTEAIPRLLNPELVEARGMLLLAVIGIAVNGLAAWRLKGDKTTNARVVALHLLEDVLGWVAVLVVSIVLLFFDVPILDPLLSVGITLYILYNVWQRLGDTVSLFLQATPAEVDVSDIDAQLMAIAGVQSVHHTHIWSLDGEHNVLTTHLVVDEATNRQQRDDIRQRVMHVVEGMVLEHITVQLEYGPDDCWMLDQTEAEQAHQQQPEPH